MSTERLRIEEHPDIAELRGRYERIGESTAVQAAAGLTVLAGLFVALSPWIVGFNTSTTITINNLVVGLAVAVLAMGFASTFRTTHGLSWVVPILGVWTIIAPWAVYLASHTTRVVLANVLGGAVVTLCGLAVLGMGLRRRNRKTA
ncbi:SPW repeat protein [Actinopolymorpha alba]|uniref:SPW repeat protein n=1 Tax=Actinopolymorpha alba TaxID=533267 RepID=UPI000374820F|nr:SPW repeat protein [Actinopolymorpha alba]